jgi:hypothetical protein
LAGLLLLLLQLLELEAEIRNFSNELFKGCHGFGEEGGRGWGLRRLNTEREGMEKSWV